MTTPEQSPGYKLESLLEIFMRRDGLCKEDAQVLINEMKERVENGEDPEEVLYDEGLEPDYIFDLIDL